MANDNPHNLRSIAKNLVQLRESQKKIIHCHGVFDLLHIGHIRYLEKAKQMGDILVVTITPDRYVNKGPHRPVFTEKIRLEVILALDCVDFAAVNEWPTAVDTIKLLKPDVYAKGAEYRKKRTPEIESEEIAIQAFGAEIKYIEDVTSSSSVLINKYMSPFPVNTQQYLEDFSYRYSIDDVLRPLEKASNLNILVVGDAIIDEYYYCEQLNKSSNAPLVVMQNLTLNKFAGGSLAVANHIAAFCENVSLVSVIGESDSELKWIEKSLSPDIKRDLIKRSGQMTLKKRRYIDAYLEIPVFETYSEYEYTLNQIDIEQIVSTLENKLPGVDLVVVADYGHGMITEAVLNVLSEKSQYLTVNAQANAGNRGYNSVRKYPSLHYITLSTEEACLFMNQRIQDFNFAAKYIAETTGADAVAITRGNAGSVVYSSEQGHHSAPSLALNVKDRVGAGDAFLAITALCAVQKVPFDILSFLGNAAGAVSVSTLGTNSPIERLPFYRHVESLMKH